MGSKGGTASGSAFVVFIWAARKDSICHAARPGFPEPVHDFYLTGQAFLRIKESPGSYL